MKVIKNICFCSISLTVIFVTLTSSSAIDNSTFYENSTTSAITSDDYISENEKNCFISRKIFACVKFKTAKFLWKLATNSYNYFPNDNSRTINGNSHMKFVHLTEPSGVAAFDNARSLAGL